MRTFIRSITAGLLLLAASHETKGQELYLNFTDGTSSIVELVELRSITFTESVLHLNFLDNSVQSWDVGEIGFMYYNENITNVEEFLPEDDVELTVYPNPSTSGLINIQYMAHSHEHLNITILDVSGRVVHQLLDREVPEGELNVSWNTQGIQRAPFSGSTYFCRVQSDSNVTTRKIVLF